MSSNSIRSEINLTTWILWAIWNEWLLTETSIRAAFSLWLFFYGCCHRKLKPKCQLGSSAQQRKTNTGPFLLPVMPRKALVKSSARVNTDRMRGRKLQLKVSLYRSSFLSQSSPSGCFQTHLWNVSVPQMLCPATGRDTKWTEEVVQSPRRLLSWGRTHMHNNTEQKQGWRPPDCTNTRLSGLDVSASLSPYRDMTARASLVPAVLRMLALTCQRRKTILCHLFMGTKREGTKYWFLDLPIVLASSVFCL